MFTEDEELLLDEATAAQRQVNHRMEFVEDLHFHDNGDGTATVSVSENQDKESTLSDEQGGWIVISRWPW